MHFKLLMISTSLGMGVGQRYLVTNGMRAQLLSCVQLFVAPWTEARQAPLSMEFPRQECWSGLPSLSPGDLPNPRSEPASPALAGGFFTTEPPTQFSSVQFSCSVMSDSATP